MKKLWLSVVALALAVAFAAPVLVRAGEAKTIDLKVTENGFEPARVKVAKGEPIKLVVTRKTDATCAKEIVIPDQNIREELPLNKPVSLSFTPRQSGQIKYSCAMGMLSGVLVVE